MNTIENIVIKERKKMDPKEFLETIRNGLDKAYEENDKDEINNLEGMYHGARTMYEILNGKEEE